MSTTTTIAAPAAPTLYELEDNLLAMLETAEGGIPEEMAAEFTAALTEALTKVATKRDRVCEVLRHYDAQIEFAKSEMERLHARMERFEIQKSRMESYVMSIMQQANTRKLEGHRFTLQLRKCPDVVVIEDESQLPAEFLREIPPVPAKKVPDKGAIKEAITKRHQDVPGADIQAGRDKLEVR